MLRIASAALLAALLPAAGLAGDAGWSLEPLEVRDEQGALRATLRAGHLPARGERFRGSVLYLEGFADSMRNHGPLFEALRDAGYRVVAFDYPGQGGSSGSMDLARIERLLAWADRAWDLHARREPGDHGRVYLGWSTGGLVAYAAAHRRQVDAVALLAPGVHLRFVVGRFGKVTLDTLTSARPPPGEDPHLDPIRPASPMLAPRFAADLVWTSYDSHHWDLPGDLPGLALLGGPEDRYVRSARTRATLAARAPHFRVRVFPEALHELDNEVEPVAHAVREEVLGFLDGLPPRP